MARKLGDTVTTRGFVTTLGWVLNRPAVELERDLGFHSGRLSGGWLLLFLKDTVRDAEVELAGTTIASGGLQTVELPGGGTVRERIDTIARARSTAADARYGTGYHQQKKMVMEHFRETGGLKRIVKLVPGIPDMPAMPRDEQYPSGSGIPQWYLQAYKSFVVGAIVGPDDARRVGGPRADRHWMDPQWAKAL